MQEERNIKGMHLGGRFIHPVDDLTFRRQMTFYRQMGVEYVNACPPVLSGLVFRSVKEFSLSGKEDYWHVDSLTRFREYVESFGLKLGLMPLPMQRWPNIILGTPERDREIEQVCQCIKAAGKAGIPTLGWSFTGVLGVVRSLGYTTGRGEIMYIYFDYDEVSRLSPHPDGPISAEQAWERIEYFIKRVVPVAEEYKVKMGCHPDDVPVPPGTPYRGIVPVLSNIDGLKRFVDLSASPYHGIIFCQGCVSEMCTSPEQVYETIRYFGERKKIFWVHFRNIRGGYLRFEESFPDEGYVDMAKALRVYKKVGYNGVLAPDHVPHSGLDTPWGHQAHAFCSGYIKALIQAIESES